MLHNIFKKSQIIYLVTDDDTYITDEDGLTYLVIKGLDVLKSIFVHSG